MNGWRSNDVAAVSSQINTRRDASAVVDDPARMNKIKMASSATGHRLYCGGQRPKPMLKALQRIIAAVFRIDVEHD